MTNFIHNASITLCRQTLPVQWFILLQASGSLVPRPSPSLVLLAGWGPGNEAGLAALSDWLMLDHQTLLFTCTLWFMNIWKTNMSNTVLGVATC